MHSGAKWAYLFRPRPLCAGVRPLSRHNTLAFPCLISKDKHGHIHAAASIANTVPFLQPVPMDNSQFSFRKRPIFRNSSQSQIPVLDHYPSQQYDEASYDPDHQRFYSKYRGVLKDKDEPPEEVLHNPEFEYNYDEKIRAPRVSLINSNFKPEPHDKEPQQLDLKAENNDYVTSDSNTEYQPASFDLSKPTRQYSESSDDRTSVPPLGELRLKLHSEPKIKYVPPVLRQTLVSDAGVRSASEPSEPSQDSSPSENVESSKSDIALHKVLSNSSITSKGVEPSHSHWKPNHSTNRCTGCNMYFSLVRRKHHCRHCGEIFCYRCVQNSANLNVLAKFEKPELDHGKILDSGGGVVKNATYCKFSKVCDRCFRDWLLFLQNDSDYESEVQLDTPKETQNTNRDRMNSVSSKSAVPNDWTWSSF
ncbi:hypothetical protein KL921_002157 [Ogataea angusta]|nr:hypothetical protein KL921_002157 [Ogataea angusta]